MLLFFFFNDTATTEIYTLSLHDALPICRAVSSPDGAGTGAAGQRTPADQAEPEHADTQQQVKDVVGVVQRHEVGRSEEHTSELQSRQYLVCRLLLEKKKKQLYSIQVTSI